MVSEKRDIRCLHKSNIKIKVRCLKIKIKKKDKKNKKRRKNDLESHQYLPLHRSSSGHKELTFF